MVINALGPVLLAKAKINIIAMMAVVHLLVARM